MAEFYQARLGTTTTPSPSLDDVAALVSGAAECLWAAKHLDTTDKPDGTGEYILLFHAIELGLKAFLLKQGVPKPDLWKKYGHDLVGLLLESKQFGLCLETPNADDMIKWINEWHFDKVKIRYEFGTKRFLPLCNAIFPLAEEILANS